MKIAVIGLGAMGLRHLQNVRELGLEICGVSDQRAAALQKAQVEQAVPAERCFEDPLEMLAKAKPECVVVATTSPGHAPLTEAAVAMGARRILCEKPMASSLEEADRMIAACGKAGVRLAINHQMRFMDQYLKVKTLLESGEFGPLASVTAVSGNMGLAMNGTHYFELFRWLTGEKPETVQAWLSKEKVPNPRGPQFEDSAGQVRVETASGKRLYMELGSEQGHGVRLIYACRWGVITTDELGGKIEASARAAEHRPLPTTRYGMPAVAHDLRCAPADSLTPSRAVLQALVSGGDIPTGQDGRSALAVVCAAYQSHEANHAPVRVEDAALPLRRRFAFA